MPHDFGQIKEAVLRSGLPLEHTLEAILRDLDWRDLAPDFSYSKRGSSADREADLVATHRYEHRSFEDGEGRGWVDYDAAWHIIAECKYRHPETCWLMAPYLGSEKPYKHYGPKLLFRGYVALRNGGTHAAFPRPVHYIDPVRQVYGLHDTRTGSDNRISVPVCSRGVVLRPTDKRANEAELRAAIQQIRFGFIPFVWSSIRSGVEEVRSSVYRPTAYGQRRRIAISVFSCFLVTTADLYVLRPDVDVETVRKAKSLDELAQRVQAAELLTFLSDELYEHNRAALASYRDWKSEDLSDPRIRRFFDYWESTASELERVSPSVFIVHVDAVRHLLALQTELVGKACLDASKELARELGAPHLL